MKSFTWWSFKELQLSGWSGGSSSGSLELKEPAPPFWSSHRYLAICRRRAAALQPCHVASMSPTFAAMAKVSLFTNPSSFFSFQVTRVCVYGKPRRTNFWRTALRFLTCQNWFVRTKKFRESASPCTSTEGRHSGHPRTTHSNQPGVPSPAQN